MVETNSHVEETDEEPEDAIRLETLVSVKSPIISRNSKQSNQRSGDSLNPSLSTLEDLDTLLGINADSNNNLPRKWKDPGESNGSNRSLTEKLLMRYRSPVQYEDPVVMNMESDESISEAGETDSKGISDKDTAETKNEEETDITELSLPYLREDMVSRLVKDLEEAKLKQDFIIPLNKTPNESVISSNISSATLSVPIVSSIEDS